MMMLDEAKQQALKQRQDFVAHAVAQEMRVAVARVLAPAQPVRFEKSDDRRA